MLGILLDVPSTTVNAIAEENDEDEQECCKEMLKEWLSIDFKASWEKLLEAVRSLPK